MFIQAKIKAFDSFIVFFLSCPFFTEKRLKE